MQLFSDPFSLGIIASLLAGVATGVGALPILMKADFSRRTLDLMLGFAAGVMLAASSFSLLVPAFAEQTVQDAGWIGVFSIVGFGFLLGGLFVHITDKYLPHEHFQKGPEGPSSSLARVWLLVIAIT
ncbi:MAG: ZIP family metal transporter, partial [Candidatus Thorarchaeota archaeon]|nr:ZIP family metal transporter [Candidatus Thorarchaeota archaeon]